MTNGIDDIEHIQMALSLGFDPDTSEPLTESRRAELEAQLSTTPTPASGPTAPGPTAPGPTAPGPQSAGGIDEETIQRLIQSEIAKAVGTPAQHHAPQSFEDVLNQVDPRDSEAALAMLEWLNKNQRLQVIGSLNGGGYLFHYQEPKGTTKEGYIPGATRGGRMVDEAVDRARAAGAKPRVTGLCDRCLSAVVRQEDGSIVLDDETASPNCAAGGTHTIN